MWALFSKQKKSIPVWFNNYLEQNFKPDARGIDDTTFVVLDCETTGLSTKDQIITLGALKCTTSTIALNQILDQKYPFHSTGQSAEIHGELYTKASDSHEKLMKHLIQYIGNHIIIGHNIAFDISIINENLKKITGAPLKNKVLDTAQLSIRLDPDKYERTVGGMSNLHLDDLCNSYQIPIENRHTALGDAYMTALLFQRIVSRLQKRGVNNLKELLR